MSIDARRPLLQQLWQRLRCPCCRASMPLEKVPGELACNGCGATFPVLPGNIPVLLEPTKAERFRAALERDPDGRRMAAEYRRYGSWRARIRSAVKPPSIVYDVDVARRYAWIYDTRGADTLVLSIGGGPGRENPRVLNVNMDAFESVDLVADGCDLPLLDESVDTVTCNAVIEHVPNPRDLVGEGFRVLKPGGYMQLMVPFVFPFHGYPGDYQRYTECGIRELTARFNAVELCVLTGPTSAMLVLFREYLRILVPGGNAGVMRLILNGISGWLTFPFKYLDALLNRKREAANLAAAFYYLGQKPAQHGRRLQPGEEL